MATQTLLDYNNPYNPLKLFDNPPPPNWMPFKNELTGIPDRIVGVLDGIHVAPDPVMEPWSAYKYLTDKTRVLMDSVRQRPLLRLWDKDMRYLGTIASEMSASLEEVSTESGTGNIVVRRDDWLTKYLLTDIRPDEDINITMDPIPTRPDWRTRWGGKVSNLSVKRTSDGLHTVEIEAISNREHLKHILFGANPIFPPEVQLPRMFFLPGNNRTINSITMLINLARIFCPLLAIPTNILNPGAWIGAIQSGGLAGFNPLEWPLQVAFVNALLDQSRFGFLTSRWTDAHTVTKDNNKDAGCIWRAYTWLTEDVDSPHQELNTLSSSLKGAVAGMLDEEAGEITEDVIQGLIRPQRNCVVFANENVSGVGGPTGTAVDGVINLVAATADDFITEILFNVDRDGDGLTDPLFRKWLAVAPAPPDIVFRDTEYSGIVESQRSLHKLQARTIMIGGKSPSWVNQLITFAIRYGLAQLSAVINYVLGAYQVQGTPGLDNLYQGQLDDVFLAYQRFTDPVRVLRGGALGFQEVMGTSSQTAYTTSGMLAIRQEHWKTRAYQAFKVTIQNGAPWLYGSDFRLGDRIGFEIGSVIHVDNVYAVKYEWSRDQPLTIGLSIGDGTEEEDPTARAMRVAQNIWGILGMALGGSLGI